MTPERWQEISDRLANEGHGWGSWREEVSALRWQRGILEGERDGWKARAEQAEGEWKACERRSREHDAEIDAAEARVAVLEKALTEVVELDYDDPATCMAWARKIAREALAAAVRPGSGAPAECPHCHVELVDGTCVAGCYYIAPASVGPTDE